MGAPNGSDSYSLCDKVGIIAVRSVPIASVKDPNCVIVNVG